MFGGESPGAAGPVALLAEHSCLLIPALGCPIQQVSLGSRWGDRSVPRVGMVHGDLGHRCGWGWELSRVCRRGDRWSPRCRQLHRDLGAVTLPHGHVDSSPGTKGLFCVTVMLPQASRGCLLCGFEDGSAPTQLMGFLPRQSRGTCQTWTASRAARMVPAPKPGRPLLPPQDRGGSRGGHTAPCALRGDRGCAGEPGTGAATAPGQPGLRDSPSRCSAPAPAPCPQALGHNTETSRKAPPSEAPLPLSCWLALGDL